MEIRFKSSLMSAGNLLISQLLLRIAGPLISLLVVRYLGPEDYGHYASALAVTALVGILADFGTNQATLKYGSRGEHDLAAAFKVGRIISYSLASLAFIITLIWFLVLDYDALTVQIGILFSLNYFVTAYRAPAAAVLQTKGAYNKLALISVYVSVSQWAATLLMLALKADVRLIAGVPIAVSGIVSLASFRMAVRPLLAETLTKIRWSYKQFLKDVWFFGLGGAFHQIYYQSDGALLSAMRPPLEVGFYNVPFRFLSIIYMVPGIVFNQVLYPKYFKLSSGDRHRYRLLYVLTSKLMLIAGTLITFGLWAFGEPAINLVFGQDFGPSTKYLIILAGAVTFRYWASASGAVLTTDNLQERKVRIQGEIAVINLGLNLALIPLYGALGAAATTVFSDLLLAMRYFQLANKASLKINPWRELKIPCFLGALLLGAIINILPGWFGVRAAVLTVLAAALLLYLILCKYLREEEMAEFFIREKKRGGEGESCHEDHQ